MPLLTRLSRLFQADLHAVLDRLEEPKTLLRQAIREMEEALADDTRRLKLLQQEQIQLQHRQQDLDHSLAGIEEELTTCLDAEADELARRLIRRKLEAQRFSSLLAHRRQTLVADLSELTQRCEDNRARLDSLHQQAELLVRDESSPPETGWQQPDFAVREEDVEAALLQAKRQRRHP